MVLEHALIDVRPGAGARLEESVTGTRSATGAGDRSISLHRHRVVGPPVAHTGEAAR